MSSEPYQGYFSIIDSIVMEITTHTGVASTSLMLVGAFCRDLLNHQHGGDLRLRRTSDTDFGVAINDWDVQRQIDAEFPRSGSTGIRYTIAGYTVDIMPFGQIEDPDGTSTPPRRSEGFSVFGFQDVYARASDLELPAAGVIKVPTAAGYAVLKLAAWLDRYPQHITKDASDLAVIVQWYISREDLIDVLYGTDDGIELLNQHGHDPRHAAIAILAQEIGDCLAPTRRIELAQRLRNAKLERMANHFSVENERVSHDDYEECLRRVEILTSIQ